MKYSGHVAGDSCCKSADRGRSHQLDTFAARISVSKVFQQRNHCVRVRVCVVCGVVPNCSLAWHMPSRSILTYSKWKSSFLLKSVSQFILHLENRRVEVGKEKVMRRFHTFSTFVARIPKFPVLSYQFPIAGSDWKAEVGNFEAGGCRVGITLPVAISHGVRTAESGNPTTHIQICSLIVCQQYDLTCFSHVLIRFICFQHVPTISNTVVVGWRSSE